MALIITLAATAKGNELPVNYLVEAKPFKKSVAAGDSLTFELHGDPNCTFTLHSEVVTAGTTELIVEKLSTEKLKGQKPRPPKGLRLITTLSPIDVVGELFLKVIGTGVIPLDEECQAQATVIPGPPGQELRVFDADGRNIGLFVDLDFLVLHEDSGVLFFVSEDEGVLQTLKQSLRFEQIGCQGTPFLNIAPSFTGRLVANGSDPNITYWVADKEPARQITQLSQRGNDGGCDDVGPDPRTVVPATEVFLEDLGLSFPLPAPLYIGTGD